MKALCGLASGAEHWCVEPVSARGSPLEREGWRGVERFTGCPPRAFAAPWGYNSSLGPVST